MPLNGNTRRRYTMEVNRVVEMTEMLVEIDRVLGEMISSRDGEEMCDIEDVLKELSTSSVDLNSSLASAERTCDQREDCGRVEEWKGGRVEGWKGGRVEEGGERRERKRGERKRSRN